MTLDTNPDARWGRPDPTHDPVILANFRPRPDDVLITTAPKAGTTWMQNILHQLRSGGDPDFQHIDDVVPWLELPRTALSHEQVLEHYARMSSPRLFKTHCTSEQTPGLDTVRIILSSRDPRDCMVSFYHHVMNMTDDARLRSGFDGLSSFDDVFELWMSFGAWFRNINSWWPHAGDRNVLWLRYEDMKQDIDASLERICRFLGWTPGEDALVRVREYISFQWMKANAGKFATHFDGKPAFKPGKFIRKGAVGDHAGSLSSAQERAILDRARAELEPQCIAFLGL